MANSKNNPLTYGLSGKVGFLIFKQSNGMTIVATTSRRSNVVSTAAQQATRVTFKQAALYAKTILADPANMFAYNAKAKPGQNALNLAIADFLKPPEIGEIDVGNYTGDSGSFIKMQVTDNFKVTAVKVRIQDQVGSVIEQGTAILQADGLHWAYPIMQPGAPPAGIVITVSATDMPGHLTTKQKTI